MTHENSGVFPRPDACGCGAEATTLTLDGDMACEACTAEIAADPAARADAADCARVEADALAERREAWGANMWETR